MKVLILNPPLQHTKDEEPYIVFPQGLGYIASVIRNESFQLSVLDASIAMLFSISIITDSEYYLYISFAKSVGANLNYVLGIILQIQKF